MQRYGLGDLLERILGGVSVGDVDRVALWRGCEINGRLRKGRVAFRHADEMDRIFRSDGYGQRLRIGVADIL